MTKTLKGYASVFYDGTAATEFEIGPGAVERVARTAFDRTLRDRPDIFTLLQHDVGKPIARTTSAPPSLYLRVDNAGLLATIIPQPTQDGSDAITLVESRTITAMSFSFQCVRDEWAPGPNGSAIRTLLDVDLMEVSAVCFPAYRATTLTVTNAERSLTHALGTYANRAASLVYEPRTLTYKGPKLIEKADERRDASGLLVQSKLRLIGARAALMAEREQLHLLPAAEAAKRESEIAKALADNQRQTANLSQCMAKL